MSDGEQAGSHEAGLAEAEVAEPRVTMGSAAGPHADFCQAENPGK